MDLSSFLLGGVVFLLCFYIKSSSSPTKTSSKPEINKPIYVRLISLFSNPYFYDKLWKRVKRFLFPFLCDEIISLGGKAMDAKLIGLDGKTELQLLDIVKETKIPLIINIGSYN
jgi:hypothetical protein